MPLLHCQALAKSFDGIRAVDSVSLAFPSSGIVAVIGPNGAGKSTLLHILSGFLAPDAGHCFLDEREITGLPPHRIARLGIARTFQDLRLIRRLSVLDNVLLACPGQRRESLWGALTRADSPRDRAAATDAAVRLLHFVGLAASAAAPAGELSYGQQKLLALACCVATRAGILLLDEPVAGVHPEMALRLGELLGRLGEEGKLIVFVEHDLATVRRIAGRVVVLDGGRILAEGTPGEVLARPEIAEAYLG